MATLHIDLSSYPLVLCRLEGESGSVDTLDADICRYSAELLAQRGDFVVVHDWSESDALSEESRDAVFDHVIRSPALAHRCIGHVVISGSYRIRNTLTALSWMRPVPYPVSVSGMPEIALRWAQRQLNLRSMDFMSRLERDQAGLNQMGF